MGFFKGLEMGGIYLKVERREGVLGQGRVVTSLRSKARKHYLLSFSAQLRDSLSSNLSKRLWRLWHKLSGSDGQKASEPQHFFISSWHNSPFSFLNHRFGWLPDNSLSWFSIFLTGPSFSSPWPLNVKCYRFYPWSTSQSPVLSRQTHPISWP